jgi:molecular chaperone GrpE (heat shock protein)
MLLKRFQEMLGIGEKKDDKASPSPVPAAERSLLAGVFEAILTELAEIRTRLELTPRIEQAVGGITPMVQFVAKGLEKSVKQREQQFLELRAHLTGELEKLAASLRVDTARAASLEVFKALLPVLDDLDQVLRASKGDEKGIKSLAILQRRLRDGFARFGITEIAVEPGKTHVDPEQHEARPWDGDPARAAGLPGGTVVEVAQAGWRQDTKLIRPAQVLISEEEKK